MAHYFFSSQFFALGDGQSAGFAVAVGGDGQAAAALFAAEVGGDNPPPGLPAHTVAFEATPDPGAVLEPEIELSFLERNRVSR